VRRLIDGAGESTRGRWPFRITFAAASVMFVLGVVGGAPADAADPNPIEIENSLTGTPNWTLTNPGTNREIEGYASLTSVARGSAIDLYVEIAIVRDVHAYLSETAS
jgi:hypothetical protein